MGGTWGALNAARSAALLPPAISALWSQKVSNLEPL